MINQLPLSRQSLLCMSSLSSVFQADQVKEFPFPLDYEVGINWSQIKLQTEKKETKRF